MRTNFVEVIDDFLCKSYHELLFNELCTSNVPWYFNSNITTDIQSTINGKSILNGFGFSHTIWENNRPTDSSYLGLILPLIYQIKDYLKASNIMRVRFDLTLYNPDILMHSPHTDYKNNHYSAIYYLNESSGNTIIFNEKYTDDHNEQLTIKENIFPKANRLVVFDGSYLHTGHCPFENNARLIINSNYND